MSRNVDFDAALRAGMYGTLAASGLLVGALVGLAAKPSRRSVALTMAFGAGTLLTAITFDLCAEAFAAGGPFVLVPGFLGGGVLYVLAAAAVDQRGGFLRREGTRFRFLHLKRESRASDVLHKLANVALIRALPASEAQAIVPYVSERTFEPGELVVEQGAPGDALYMIVEGEAEVLDGSRSLTTLAAGETFGEMALLSDQPRNATVRAKTSLHTYRISREDFDHLLGRSPVLALAAQHLLEDRLTARGDAGLRVSPTTWRKVAEAHLSRQLATHEEHDILAEHRGSAVPLAIFMGALIDGIPESFVIGAAQADAGTPTFSFLLAVFLSNFPEAMSSASGMTRAGFSSLRVLSMWLGLLAIAGVSAALGQVLCTGAPLAAIAFAKSAAAGSILALLANTMMPEAFMVGGRATAFATSVGFLVAFLATTLR